MTESSGAGTRNFVVTREASSELVLVESERQAEYEAARGRRASTLHDFAAHVLAEGAPELRAAPIEATRLLTRCALPEQPLSLALSVADAVSELRRAGTEPADFGDASGPRGQLLARALRDTSLRLAELRLRDERASAWLAARVIDANGVREFEGVRSVRVRGVSHWDSGTLALLDALHRRLRAASGGGVVVELPAPRSGLGAALSDALSQVAARLERRWATHGDHPDIEHGDPLVRPSASRVVRAAHEASEARAVARAVLDALASGAALDSVAIAPLEAADAFLEPLRAELDAARLPFSEAWSTPAMAAPEAHAALELIRLAQGPLVRDALIDVLRVPDLELAHLLGYRPRVDFVGALGRLPVRVDRGGQLLAAIATRRARLKPAQTRARESLDVAEQVVSALLARFEPMRAPHTRRAFRDLWRALFADLGLLSASRRGLAQAIAYADRGDHAPLAALGQNAHAARAIDLALERSVAAADLLGLGGETLPLSDFFDEFSAALGAVGANPGAGRAGALRIARPAELAGSDWDCLIVCRAASSTLDWQRASSDGVLDAELLERLPVERRPPSAAERALFTRGALASCMSRAKRIVVTWAARDARGQSGQSRLVTALEHSESSSEPASPLDAQARRLTALAPAGAEVRARAKVELARQAFYADPDHAVDPQNGAAGPLDRWAFGDATRPLALTALERYARCGFLGFSGSVLRAVRDDAVGDGLGARERGSLIHEALAVALADTRRSFGTLAPEDLERQALARAEAFLGEHASTSLRGAALSAALEDVAALLRWSFANTDGEWFAEGERGFGNGEEWSALPVGAYFVSGRIDRIDSNGDASSVRIIDYKTGTVRLGGEHGNQLLQPWLYAKKVAEQYGARRVSSGYLSLKRRKPEWRGALESADVADPAITEKLTRAEELMMGLRGGHVPARPAVAGSCSKCDARDICRRPLSAPHESNE